LSSFFTAQRSEARHNAKSESVHLSVSLSQLPLHKTSNGEDYMFCSKHYSSDSIKQKQRNTQLSKISLKY